jgi:HEAT repeat protein
MEAPIQARIGLGAILENLQNEQILRDQVPALSELARHTDSRVRGDACYYLGLSGSPEALPVLNERLTDDNTDVREIASEAITMISG